MRPWLIALALTVLFVPIAVAASPAPQWIQTLPTQGEKNGYTQHLFPLENGIGAIISGNFEGRPLVRLNNVGLLLPGIILNNTPAQQVVVGKNTLLLCNNNYILNQSGIITVYSHQYQQQAEIPTPFVESAAAFIPAGAETEQGFYALAGTRFDGTNELWAIDEEGNVLWKKAGPEGTGYTASFGVGAYNAAIVLAIRHKQRGLEIVHFSRNGEKQNLFAVPQFPPSIRYPQVIVPTLFFDDYLLTGGFSDDTILRLGLIHMPTATIHTLDLTLNVDAAQYLRLVKTGEKQAAVALGNTIYSIPVPHGTITTAPSPLPQAFLVSLAPAQNGDLFVGGSLQLPEATWPAPFVARFLHDDLLPKEGGTPVATWPSIKIK